MYDAPGPHTTHIRDKGGYVATVTATYTMPAGIMAGGPGIASMSAVALRNAAGGSTMPWVFSILGVLVVGGAASIGLSIWRRRRGRQPDQ